MSKFKSYLAFERFIMPFALQFLFWSGIAGALYGTWWLFAHDNWAWMLSLVFGTLVTRLLFESLMIRYKTYEYLKSIKERLHERD